ncbi:MAG: EamA family transporter [Erysipelotrichaceae bacterium]|nr:EamA family transporter [Erysipelotrichaceae bacterium]
MWLILSLIAALSTSLTTIFAKIGINNVKSNFATFYRSGIIIICCVIICFISKSYQQISSLSLFNWLFLSLSAIASGCSWLCYYKALKISNINKVAPIDKSSYILSSILFLIFFFDDTTKGGDVLTICMILLSSSLIFIGTILMINKQKNENVQSKKWLIYAILSAIFASVVSLFVKIGLSDIPSDLGTLIRSIIVFIFTFFVVIFKKDYRGVRKIDGKSWLFLTLSGLATNVAWLCEYYALNMTNSNPIAINSITKLSILLTMFFSYFILKEKFSKKSLLGLSLLTSGIVVIIIFSL